MSQALDPVERKLSYFMSELSHINLPDTFNPWRDTCPDCDRPNATAIRRSNLRNVLGAALRADVEHVWVGRDLGYLGGRRTGLAMTDELHLNAQAKMWNTTVTRATTGKPRGERTASEVWQWMARLKQPTFFWNVFPVHPHRPGDPKTNRPHTRLERDATIHLLRWLVNELRPQCVVALGRDAQRVLNDLGIANVAVRHPSMGGLNDFRNSMARFLP
jgi:uracil-DNA glycosylase